MSLFDLDAEDKTLLNVGSKLRLEGVEYYLFTSYDVTEIYHIYQSQLRFISLVSIAFALITGLILWAGMRHLLRPLTEVKRPFGKSRMETISEDQGAGKQRIPGADREHQWMTEAIETIMEQLRQVADSRKRFVDSLAHEMKTPLTSVMCLGIVLSCKRVVTDSERQEYARIIVRRLKG